MTIHSFNEVRATQKPQQFNITFQFNELTKPHIRSEGTILIRLLNSILDSSNCPHLMEEVASKTKQLIASKNVDDLLMYYFRIELDIINETVIFNEIRPYVQLNSLKFSLN